MNIIKYSRIVSSVMRFTETAVLGPPFYIPEAIKTKVSRVAGGGIPFPSTNFDDSVTACAWWWEGAAETAGWVWKHRASQGPSRPPCVVSWGLRSWGVYRSRRHSLLNDSLRPHGRQPTRLLCPWDSPGKNMAWIALPFSRGSSQPRDLTRVSRIAGGLLTV